LDSNTTAGSDTIVFSPGVFNVPRTITLASVLTINPATGDSLTITGPGANLLTVSGNNAVRIFAVSAGDTASISGMTLTLGTTVGAGASGSAINNLGNLTVTNATFSSNTAGWGGAIANSLSLTVTGCTFTENTATSASATGLGGGAIHSNTSGTASISNSTFTGNDETGGSGGGGAVRNRGGTMNITNSTFSNNSAVEDGGAVQNNSVMTITGCIISGNTTTGAGAGGGGLRNESQLTLVNTIVTGNSAPRHGGGIYHGADEAGDFLHVIDSTISNNTANTERNATGYGGGIYVEGNPATVTRSTISGNTVLLTLTPNENSRADGGGIWSAGMLTMDSSTVSGNHAGVAFGGVRVPHNGSDSTITSSTIVNNSAASFGGGLGKDYCNLGCRNLSIGNTIIANNTAPSDSDLSNRHGGTGNPVISLGYNLVENTGTNFSPGPSDLTGVDPNTGPLQNNGGLTFTHALLAGSPAVDKGNSFSSTTDQRGIPRPFDNAAIPNAAGGNGADIGAFEVTVPVVLGVVSRKVHGASGTFDINLSTTPGGVECRTGPNYQAIVTFAAPVTVGGLSIMSSDGQASGTRSVNGPVATVNLTAVANAQTLGITLLNVNDGSATGDVFVPMSVLVGDTTNNGSVTGSDVAQVKSLSGQTVTGANFRADVNASGASINASDIGLVKSRTGTVLP
jgi:hypothetical protein